MNKEIAVCGFDCSTCEVRIATVKNDNSMRSRIAGEWKVRYKNPDVLPEMINCDGCTGNGYLNKRCEACEIRACALSKSYQTCAECKEMEECLLVKKMFQYVPEALENLKSLQREG